MQEMLIDKVRNHMFLYNRDMRDYKDQNMRNIAWEQIGKELKIPACQAKEMWAKLRNCYTNALKRRSYQTYGPGQKKYIPWKYEREMAFLQNYLDLKRNNATQLKEEPEDQWESESFEATNDDSLAEEDPIDEATGGWNFPSESKNQNTCASIEPPPQKKCRTSMEETVEIMNQNAQYAQYVGNLSQRSQENTRELDESDMFYLSMSRIMKKLPEIDQAQIRMELCKLVSETQIRHLQNQQPTSVASSFS